MRRLPTTLLAALLLAGCGGGDDGEARLSKSAFSEQGARICREGAEEAKAVAARELAKPEAKRLDRTQQQFLALEAGEATTRRTMDRLGALRAPEEVEPEVRRLRAGVLETIDVLSGLKEAAQQEDQAKLSAATTKVADLASSTRNAATKAGLSACLPENTP